MFNRRHFIQRTSLLGMGLALPWKLGLTTARAAQSPQIPLAGKTIAQFVDPLPDLDVIVAGNGQIELQMTEFQAQVLPSGMPLTHVWGYLQPGQLGRGSYLGPVIVATRGVPTEMKVVNNLGNSATTNVLAYKHSTDQTLHWADPHNGGESMGNHMAMPPAFGSEGSQNYDGPIPACVHLHGGEVPPLIDGGPSAWFTSDGQYIGKEFYSKDGSSPKNYSIYRYPNSQEGSPIWFHDHTMGATRLNVYCGLAGGYLIVDPANDPQNMPPLVPLVIQDRMFDTNGQLFFPSAAIGGVLWTPNPEHPYWVPEFLGDVICVNGKAWPFKTVERRRYTFLLVNGSNARTYDMALIDPVSANAGPAIWVVGTDGGYLDKPVKIAPNAAANNKLTIMPGERYMIIVDFEGYQAGVMGPNGKPYSGRWQLKNTARAPYPAGATAQGATTGKIMEFRVGTNPVADTSFNPATINAVVRPTPMVRLVDPVVGTLATGVTVQKRRQLTLNEVMGMPQTAPHPVNGVSTAFPGGPLEILVNNTKFSGKRITGVDADTGMYMMEPIPGFTLDGAGMHYLSEVPQEGETEIWEIINLTADAHPMHLHLVQFQLMNRQNIDVRKYSAAYAAAFPGGGYDPMTGLPYAPGVYIPGFGPPMNYNTGNPAALGGNPDVNAVAKARTLFLSGAPVPPLPQEAGWKDTVKVLPAQVTRLVVRWAPTSVPANTPPSAANFPFDPNEGGAGYVWHCHIVDHEDNEMMRPDAVAPNAVTRSYIQGVDY